MGPKGGKPPPKRPRKVPADAAHSQEREAHHQQIQLFGRLAAFPVIQFVLQHVHAAYLTSMNSSPPVIQATMIFAYEIISSATSRVLSAAERFQIVLDADRRACEVLDWTFTNFPIMTSRTPLQYVQIARRHFNIVIRRFFALLANSISELIRHENHVRRSINIVMETIHLATDRIMDFLYPPGHNPDRNGPLVHWVVESVRGIVESFLEIPHRISRLLNELYPGCYFNPRNPAGAASNAAIGAVLASSTDLPAAVAVEAAALAGATAVAAVLAGPAATPAAAGNVDQPVLEQPHQNLLDRKEEDDRKKFEPPK